ncbi:ATP-binding protein [Metabacillus niabensis]|uniref:ATP-binding protein n=1 Tax=Metabacillus niabensis TaxID=324854 RepID=UPI0039A31101
MLPILYIEDNRLFDTKGNAYAIYKIDSVPYAYQPNNTRRAIIHNLVRGITSNLTGEFLILLLTKQWSPEQILGKMNTISKHEIWRNHQKEVAKNLQYFLPFNRENLIVVPLGKKKFNIDLEQENVKDFFKQFLAGIKDVKESITPSQETIPLDRLERARRESEEIRTKLSSIGRVTKAKIADIEWWLKRSYFRGLQEPKNVLPMELPYQVTSESGRSILRPTRSIYMSLSDISGKEKATRMEFSHPDGSTSYQTFFTTANILRQPIPEDDPTGFEWIYGILEQNNFPIDCALHLRIDPPNVALSSVKDKKKIAKAQFDEWDEAGEDIPIELEEDLDTVDQLEQKLRAKNPLVFAKIIFGIGADSLDLLRERSTQFKNSASTFHTVVQAPSDMKRMFQAFYPFGESLPKTWEIPMDVGVLGAGVPFGSKSLGDPFGFWLGRLSTGRPVWMDPRRPAQELNSTNAIMIVGTLGSGKSYLMKYLSSMILSWGAKGFLIDPKGDTLPMANMPFSVKVLNFTAQSDTAFSPFRIGGLQDSRAVIEILFNTQDSEERQVLLNEALEEVFKSEKWDMYTFYEILKQNYSKEQDPIKKKEINLVAQRVRLMQQHEIGKMFFGRDTGEEAFKDDFVIAITRGLPLPDKTTPKERWTENERYAGAIMYSVATLGLRNLMSFPRSVLKYLAIDESWVLRRFEQGTKLLNEALRFSRSENLIPIIASQNATDFVARENEEDLTGLFAWKFMLHLESESQVEASLKILGMTDSISKDWVNRFARYSNGYGLVRDPEGRIGEMQVEVIPNRQLDRYFNSTPKEKISE